MKIAIIGSGISGLGAAYLLNPVHDITVFEKNDYIGGHSRTRTVRIADQQIPVDTGFIVFNDQNYPNLCALFELLDVPIENSDMSFGVSINQGDLEYSSNNMLAQKRNLFRPKYWRMLKDVIHFNKHAESYLNRSNEVTLEQCLKELKLSEWFKQYYLLAMGAAIWSCPVETMLKFPAKTFIRFFKNHGLLTINQHPQWKTVSGGSHEYIKRLTKPFSEKIKLNCGVTNVYLDENKIKVVNEQNASENFDHVIFACHADEALQMIQNTPKEIFSVLNHFQYQKNKIILHSDTSFMPKNLKCWSSWIYLNETNNSNNNDVSLSYWMNNLQNIDKKHSIIITLNPGRQPDTNLIHEEHEFSHPIFTSDAINAQEDINSIQGQNNLWFCGAYQRYGFHEDGLLSAVNLVKKMGVKIPWH